MMSREGSSPKSAVTSRDARRRSSVGSVPIDMWSGRRVGSLGSWNVPHTSVSSSVDGNSPVAGSVQ